MSFLITTITDSCHSYFQLHCLTREKSTSIRLRIYKGVCEGSEVVSQRPGRGLGVETDHTGQTSLLMMSDPFEM